MIKDFLPVSDKESKINAIDYLERYWTALLEGQDLQLALKRSAGEREEVKRISKYLSKIPAKARFLEGGCGIGMCVLYFSLLGYDVTGIDISRKIIEKLKDKFPGHSQKFIVGDIRETGFQDNSFDAYFAWGVFEHFEVGLAPCLEEANRILKPGGFLFFSVPFQNCRFTIRSLRRLSIYDDNFDRKNGYPSKIRFYQWRFTRAELQRELEINGFKTQEIRPIGKEHGIHNIIKSDLHLRFLPARLKRIINLILYPLIPSSYGAHLLLAVGVKN